MEIFKIEKSFFMLHIFKNIFVFRFPGIEKSPPKSALFMIFISKSYKLKARIHIWKVTLQLEVG